ncbi:hypothetical protein [Streptomyces sp. IBSBF 2435]|uniref:hypothetical protein n=1 Tax=Streptomyces sp. IBSBF 2435 TaxID=2903531 RepID=UPI002FDBF164
MHKEAAPADWTPKGQAAKGASLARATVVNQRVSRLASRSYVSGYHTETRETAVASSGPGYEGCEGTYCAEGNVVHALGGDWTKVRSGVAYVQEKIQGTDPAMYQPAVTPVCLECKLDYPLSNFVPGITSEPDGPWSEP